MQIIRQKGYDTFTCIADACPESCCKFWQIVVDDDSMESYKKLSENDKRVCNSIDEKESVFRQSGRICAFLDPDELCYLQKTYGEDVLCATCRNYPRHIEEFENVREYSLSLSCPHAASMLLNDDEEMSFDCAEDDAEEEYEDFDYLLYDKLLDARDFLFETTKDRSRSLSSRFDTILRFGDKLQSLLDEDQLFRFDDAIESFRAEVKTERPSFQADQDMEKRVFSLLYDLEMLHDDWPYQLEMAWKDFFLSSCAEKDNDRFNDFVKENETAGEQLLMLFLYTYFCGAVYDGWIRSKVLLSVFSVKWIFYIAFANGATKSALVKAAYQYAREIEHSDRNLDQLEEWFMEHEPLS